MHFRPTIKLFLLTSIGRGVVRKAPSVSLSHSAAKSAAPGRDVRVRQCLIGSTASEINSFLRKTETK